MYNNKTKIYIFSVSVYSKLMFIRLIVDDKTLTKFSGQSRRRGTKCEYKLVRSVPTSGNEISGVKAKRNVKFRHSTRNLSEIRRKVGNRSVIPA